MIKKLVRRINKLVFKRYKSWIFIFVMALNSECYKKGKCQSEFETFDFPVVEIIDWIRYSRTNAMDGIELINDSISFYNKFLVNSELANIDFKSKTVIYLDIEYPKLKKRYIENFHYQLIEASNEYRLLINLCTQRDVKIPGYGLKKGPNRKINLFLLNKIITKPIKHEVVKDF